MQSPLLIAIIAGAASAVLYLSVATGSVLSMLLFYAAPLPLFVAGLGWGLPAGVIAGLIGTGGALLLGPFPSFLFLLTIAAPSVWLIRLTLLSRDDGAGSVAWYPIDRLLLWIAGLAAALVLVALPAIGYGTPEFEARVQDLFSQGLLAGDGVEVPDGLDAEATGETMAALVTTLLPTMAAATWMMITLLNLWLGARIAEASGTLRRPWPNMRDVDLPPVAAMAFGGAIVLGFAPGPLGLVGQIGGTVLGLAFLLLGLAVLHCLVRPSPARRLILGGIYLLLLIQPWVAVVFVGLGLSEALTDVRARRLKPPSGPSSGPPSGSPPGAA